MILGLQQIQGLEGFPTHCLTKNMTSLACMAVARRMRPRPTRKIHRIKDKQKGAMME